MYEAVVGNGSELRDGPQRTLPVGVLRGTRGNMVDIHSILGTYGDKTMKVGRQGG